MDLAKISSKIKISFLHGDKDEIVNKKMIDVI